MPNAAVWSPASTALAAVVGSNRAVDVRERPRASGPSAARNVARAGVTIHAIELPAAGLRAALRRAAGPVVVADTEEQRAVIVDGRGWCRAKVRPVAGRPLRATYTTLASTITEGQGPELTGSALGLTPALAGRFDQSLRRAHAGSAPVRCFLVDLPVASTRERLRLEGTFRRLVHFLASNTVEYVLLLAAWFAVVAAVLQDERSVRDIVSWSALLVGYLCVRGIATWSWGIGSLDAGRALRAAIAAQALRGPLTTMRAAGSGRLLGRVLDVAALEARGSIGGIQAVVAAGELAFACAVLALAGAGALVAGLVLLTGVISVTGRRLIAARTTAVAARRELAGEFVEELVGHRTTLARGDAVDRASTTASSDAYAERLREADRLTVVVRLLGFMWLPAALLFVATVVEPDDALTATAVVLGGVVLAHQGFERLGHGLTEIADAVAAWHMSRPAGEGAVVGQVSGARVAGATHAVLEARGLVVRHPAASPLVTIEHLSIGRGDAILLDGPSGGGKSSLAKILAGLAPAAAGTVTLNDDITTVVGDVSWRRRVAYVADTGENALFDGSLLFNLLLGSGWPPRPGDRERAVEVLAGLGLSELVARMPLGLDQPIGETGWRMSHGEQGRIYVARALLQEPDVVILDESFAPLDAVTLSDCVAFVRARVGSVVIIAHP